jgi:glutamate dehydrogenase/leucine dehydrogenase
MIATREAAKHVGIDITKARVALQGFGNVGSISAQLLGQLGARVVAVTDWKGGVYNDNGIDVEQLMAHVQQHQTVHGFSGAEPLGDRELFGLDVDILIPAALENQITKDNAPAIKARIIVEGANGPTTPDAHRHLHERGVFVVPTSSPTAAASRPRISSGSRIATAISGAEKEVNERLELKMCEAFDAVLKTSLKYNVDMRTAAYVVAINRVATVTRMRGMYA